MRKATAIDTSAVAMTELLTGLSVAPMSIGVMNRGPNGRSCAAAASAGRLPRGAVSAAVPAMETIKSSSFAQPPADRA